MSLRPTLQLLCLLAVPIAQAAEVNLALLQSGGIPSALASAPNLRYSAQKACDGNAATAWVSAADSFPVWLQIEWQIPVRIDRVSFRGPSECPITQAGQVGRYRVEVERSGRWQTVATGDGSQRTIPDALQHTFDESIETKAVRLQIESAPTGQVAIGELEVSGPELVLPVEWLPRWEARWIWCEPSLVIPHREPIRRYFRRSFDIEDPAKLREVWLLAGAFDRLNNVWVNNRPVLQHGSLHGGSLREALVKKIPVDCFVAGENVLAAEVDDLYECGSQGLLAELVLIEEDGARTSVVTDEQWLGQEDQGVTPDWRKPNLKDKRWVPCRVKTWPNTRWHWLWNVRRPLVAPQDTVEVTNLRVEPQPVRPGEDVIVHVTLSCPGPLTRDYAAVVRLGRDSLWRDHEFELWGAVRRPDELRTSTWQAGTQQLVVTVPVPDYAPRHTRATLMLSTPAGGVGMTTTCPSASTDAYGLHFTIPVDRGDVSEPPAGDFPLCELRTVNGNPALHIDGAMVPPLLWSSSYASYRRYSSYAATGVKLFRVLLEGSPICAPGEEEAYYPWWFEQVDHVLSAAVDIDPENKLMIAVRMDPNPQWLFDSPSEQMLGGRGNPVIPLSLLVPDRGQVRPTFMSQAWRRAGGEGLKRLIGHLRRQPYAPNIIGVCLFAGRAGENYWGGNERNLFINEQGGYDARPREQWDTGDFSMAARRTFREFLLRKYGTDESLQQAWRRPGFRLDDVLEPARFDKGNVCNILAWAGKPDTAGSLRDSTASGTGTLPADYYQCFAEAMIDTFAAWGEAVKAASDGRLMTGCFYGYAISQLYTSVPGFHGHTAVARAARTPHLDFFVSPSEYNAARRPGGPYWGLNVVDSLRLHNKLWIYEQDTRTFLAEHMPKTFSRPATIEVMKRDAAAGLTRGAGWWWYEFSKGQGGAQAREWFIDPEIAALASRLKAVYRHALTLPDRSPSSQIAVFYHGETLPAQDIFPPTLQINITVARLTMVNGMQRVGAPFELYNLADIPVLRDKGLLDQYKLCLFLNPFYLTPEERGWLDACKGQGRTLVWLWAPGMAGPDRRPAAEHVSETVGIPGIRALPRKAVQTYRLADVRHPILDGLDAGAEFKALPFPPGSTWERYGNEVWPVLYVDVRNTGRDVSVLGHWVLDDRDRPELGALCLRDIREADGRQWRSVYAAVPLLTPELLRGIAREAGVHLYWEANDIMFADRRFVALHSGSEPLSGVLSLPRSTPVVDVFQRRVIAADAQTVPVTLQPFTTTLFYLGEPRAFLEATRMPGDQAQ